MEKKVFLTNEEVKSKSFIGARWLFVTNIVSMPASFIISFLLGRTSPEALGALGLVQIFTSLTSTFIIFGGQTVLRNYMAKIIAVELRGRLFFTYSLILLILLTLMLSVFNFCPVLFRMILNIDVGNRTRIYFSIYAILIVASVLLSSAHAGMMNLKWSSITQSIVQIGPLPIIAVLFITNRKYLAANAFNILLVTAIITYTISAVTSGIIMAREKKMVIKPSVYLPKGFVPFCLTTHLATIFTFFYNDVDKIFMLKLGEMGGLGMYQAIVSINRTVQYIPNMLSAALVPMFSTLISTGQVDAIRNGYHYVQKYSSLTIVVLSLGVISFCNELLSLFGAEYGANHRILAMFGLTAILQSLFIGNTAILTSYEKNGFRLLVSTVQIAIQLTGTYCFIGRHGILAVAGFKMIGVLWAQIIVIPYVIIAMKMKLKIPRVYYVGGIIGSLTLIIKLFVVREQLYFSVALFIIAIGIFVPGARITTRDISLVTKIFFKKNK